VAEPTPSDAVDDDRCMNIERAVGREEELDHDHHVVRSMGHYQSMNRKVWLDAAEPERRNLRPYPRFPGAGMRPGAVRESSDPLLAGGKLEITRCLGRGDLVRGVSGALAAFIQPARLS
jgi:hypothetical protein